MRRRIRGLRWTALIALVVATSLMGACHKHMGGHITAEKMAAKLSEHVEHALKKIGATKEQRVKIGLVTNQISADAIQTHRRCASDHAALAANLLSDAPNREELHRQVDQKALVVTEFMHRSMDRMIEISSLLTPEQRSVILQRCAERAQKDGSR